MKEIYIEIKDKSKVKEVVGKMIKLMEEKKIPTIHSLDHFLKMKGCCLL